MERYVKHFWILIFERPWHVVIMSRPICDLGLVQTLFLGVYSLDRKKGVIPLWELTHVPLVKRGSIDIKRVKKKDGVIVFSDVGS